MTTQNHSKLANPFLRRFFQGASLLVGISLLSCGDDRNKGEVGNNNSSGQQSEADTGEDSGQSQQSEDSQLTDEDTMRFDFEAGQEDPCSDPDGVDDMDDVDEYDFSIIWVANSGNGTVSKIDTRKAKELARYRTGASDRADPSRTSVNLKGDVAVVNRTGTVIKISATKQGCVDKNNNGMIETSTGPNDVLDWGKDECVLWEHDLGISPDPNDDNKGGPRAVAWEIGDPDDDPCAHDTRLWIGYRKLPGNVAAVRRLNPDGTTDDEALIDNWEHEWGHGIYGGAVDRRGNFWGIGSRGTLVRVDADDFSVQSHEIPGRPVIYGMVMDGDGNAWMSGWENQKIYRYDSSSKTFRDYDMPTSGMPIMLRGLVLDRKNQLWIAGNTPCGLVRFDTKKREFHDQLIPLDGCAEPVGVTIDSEEYVWIVDRMAEQAYKLNRDSLDTETVGNLNQPYTYSDMTGHALHLVEDPHDIGYSARRRRQ